MPNKTFKPKPTFKLGNFNNNNVSNDGVKHSENDNVTKPKSVGSKPQRFQRKSFGGK